MKNLDLARIRSVGSEMAFAGMTELLSLKTHLQPYSLKDTIILEWHEQLALALDKSSAWVYGPAELDPARGSTGQSVVPAAQLRQLKKIKATGVPIQRMAIAHEIPLSGPVRRLLPALREGPLLCGETAARELVGPPPPHPGVSRAAKALDSLIGGAGGSMQTSVRAVGSRMLDPIIFGVIAPDYPRDGEPALWIPLVAWRW